MLVARSADRTAEIRRMDARSRVLVWLMNHARKPEIAKLGLSHIADGACNAWGTVLLHADGPGLVLEKNTVELCRIDFAGGSQMVPVPQRSFCEIPPNGNFPLVNDIFAGLDPVFIADKLGLFRHNMDRVSGPKLFRTFIESSVTGLFAAELVMPCYDADGNFKVLFGVFGGAAFEVKFFKYGDKPGFGGLLFAPRESAVYVPMNCDGTFAVNTSVVCLNAGVGWIGTADGAEKLEWDIFKRFGAFARIVWVVFPNDPLMSKNNFAEAFSLVTEARRHGVNLKMLRATAAYERYDGCAETTEQELNEQEIRKIARRYRMKIDSCWSHLPGEIEFEEEIPVKPCPPFWQNNRAAVFFGTKSLAFLLELLKKRASTGMLCFNRIWVIVEEKEKMLATQIFQAGGSRVRCGNFSIFDTPEEFLGVLSDNDAIFLVAEEATLPQKAVDFCRESGLPIGIFFRREESAPQMTELNSVSYCVKKFREEETVFGIKNMDNETITKYTFSPLGVNSAPGTEDEMKSGE